MFAASALRNCTPACTELCSKLKEFTAKLVCLALDRAPAPAQEWLWCETWCGNATLGTAKTIDLCNNPLTKEPKLAGARRIVAEWPALDAEVTAFTAQVPVFVGLSSPIHSASESICSRHASASDTPLPMRYYMSSSQVLPKMLLHFGQKPVTFFCYFCLQTSLTCEL